MRLGSGYFGSAYLAEGFPPLLCVGIKSSVPTSVDSGTLSVGSCALTGAPPTTRAPKSAWVHHFVFAPSTFTCARATVGSLTARIATIRPTKFGSSISSVDSAPNRGGTQTLECLELGHIGIVAAKSVAPAPRKERHVRVGALLGAGLR